MRMAGCKRFLYILFAFSTPSFPIMKQHVAKMVLKPQCQTESVFTGLKIQRDIFITSYDSSFYLNYPQIRFYLEGKIATVTHLLEKFPTASGKSSHIPPTSSDKFITFADKPYCIRPILTPKLR